jgi:hypothetical protein
MFSLNVMSQPEPDRPFQDSLGQQFTGTDSMLSSTWGLRGHSVCRNSGIFDHGHRPPFILVCDSFLSLFPQSIGGICPTARIKSRTRMDGLTTFEENCHEDQ